MGQNLEQLNVERPIFRISEISNVEKTKDPLFGFIIFDLKKNYICLNYSNTQAIWFIVVKYCKFMEFW